MFEDHGNHVEFITNVFDLGEQSSFLVNVEQCIDERVVFNEFPIVGWVAPLPLALQPSSGSRGSVIEVRE